VLDLEENDFEFGEMQNWTAALNWYLNPNVILRLNYIQTQLEEVAVVDGDDSPHTDMIMMRLQVDF
jgi:phosphate-selective porin OprO/OprP